MRDNGKRYDDCTWWERGRYNHFDDDESIWRNTNMIWLFPAVITAVFLFAALFIAYGIP